MAATTPIYTIRPKVRRIRLAAEIDGIAFHIHSDRRPVLNACSHTDLGWVKERAVIRLTGSYDPGGHVPLSAFLHSRSS